MKLLHSRKNSVRTRLIIGMGVMLMPLIVLAGGALFAFERGISAFEQTENETLEELFPLADLESLIIKVSKPIEDYVSTGDAANRGRFIQLSQQVDRSFTAILATPSNLPEKQALIRNSLYQWQQAQTIAKTILADPNPVNNPRVAQTIARFYSHIDLSVSSVDRLYKLLAHLQINHNIAQAKSIKQIIKLMITAVFLLGLAIAITISLILARSILLPLRGLQKSVAHIGEGDFSYKIATPSQDELGQLATAFNLMTQKLEYSQAELKKLATMDSLTQVYNRHEFNLLLSQELVRSHRYSHCFSLLILDIDYFKKLNDTYGHPSGDEALRATAALIKQEIRCHDQVARYGGEEFVVILPETSSSSASILAERLRSAIATHDLLIDGEQTLKVTVSIGLATFPQDGVSEKALISKADQALYAAKHLGRNRVVIASNLDIKSK